MFERQNKRDTSTARDKRRFENYHYYFRTHSRDSANYETLVKRTHREPDIIYPKGWYEFDTDSNMVGTGCVHVGIKEFKRVDNLEGYSWSPDKYYASREFVKKKLTESAMQIEHFTLNYTLPDCQGVLSPRYNFMPSTHENYSDYVKQIKHTKAANNELGKGVFLVVFCADNMKYFCPINFTGSEHVFGGDKWGVGSAQLTLDLEYVADILEPCFNEYLFFLLHAYIRQDFDTLARYLLQGEKRGLVRYSADWERVLSETFADKDRVSVICRWSAFCEVIEALLYHIHFDTMLDTTQDYLDFVELVRSGEIGERMREMFMEHYKASKLTYRMVG